MKMTMTRLRPSLKAALLAPVALIGLAAAPYARADSLLLAQTTLVSGTESTVDSFTTAGAGTVTINLKNVDWPTPLTALSFSATSADHVLAHWDQTGSVDSTIMTFDVATAGTYFAHIMATAGGTLDLGLYAMTMTFTPSAVPLPASGWMLLIGIFALAGLARAIRPFELMGAAEA
jgi:hypothetical protein